MPDWRGDLEPRFLERPRASLPGGRSRRRATTNMAPGAPRRKFGADPFLKLEDAAPARARSAAPGEGRGARARCEHGRDVRAPTISPPSPLFDPVGAVDVDAHVAVVARAPRYHAARSEYDHGPGVRAASARRCASVAAFRGRSSARRRQAEGLVLAADLHPHALPLPLTAWHRAADLARAPSATRRKSSRQARRASTSAERR